MGANFDRVYDFISLSTLTAQQLDDELNQILDKLTPTHIDDHSASVAQMRLQTSPGSSGSESQATSLAGELERVRYMLDLIIGETYWYDAPDISLSEANSLLNQVSGIPDNRIVSGAVQGSGDNQPIFLVANGSAATVRLAGGTTSFVYRINGTEYQVSTNVDKTGLSTAPSTNNTCLVNDSAAADQNYTKYVGEESDSIPVDTMGTEITALVGKFAAFKLDNGTASEYLFAYVKSSTELSQVRRGFFFSSANASIPRVVYTNNDTITLMRLTWVFVNTAGGIEITYNNPTWSRNQPGSPNVGDFWFDLENSTWKKYDGAVWNSANALLIGICIQDTTNCVAARSFDFFDFYKGLNTIDVVTKDNTSVQGLNVGGQVSVAGNDYKFDYGVPIWDITADLESGFTEAASTEYYLYVTDLGGVKISPERPYNRADLAGFYHPYHPWRCVGVAFNNGSSNLAYVVSFSETVQRKRYRVKYLAANASSTGDVSDLTFTDLIPNRTWMFIVVPFFSNGHGTFDAVKLYDGASSGGTLFGQTHFNPGGATYTALWATGSVFIRRMNNATMTLHYTRGATSGTLVGGSTVASSHIYAIELDEYRSS